MGEAGYMLLLLLGAAVGVCVGAPLVASLTFGIFGLVGGANLAFSLRNSLPNGMQGFGPSLAVRWALGFTVGGIFGGLPLFIGTISTDTLALLSAVIGYGVVGALGGGIGGSLTMRRLVSREAGRTVQAQLEADAVEAAEDYASPAARSARSVIGVLFGTQALLALFGLCFVIVRPFSRIAPAISKQPSLLSGHTQRVRAAAISPDGGFVLTGADDNTARLWEASTGEQLLEFSHGGDVTAVAVAPAGSQVATASADSTVRLWDARSGDLEYTFENDNSGYLGLAYAPDGSLLAAVGGSGFAEIWDPKSGERLHRLIGDDSLFYLAVFSPDGSLLATAGWYSDLILWDTATGMMLQRFEYNSSFSAIEFSPDGGLLAAASLREEDVILWDTATGEKAHILEHEEWAQELAFTAQGARLVTWSRDDIVSTWDSGTGELLASFEMTPGRFMTYQGSLGSVIHVAIFSADGTRLARVPGEPSSIARVSGPITIWDTTTGEQLPGLDDIRYPVSGARFSSDGSRMVVWYETDALQLWDLP